MPMTTARMSGTEMLELAPMNAATMTSTPTALMNAMLPIATLITQPGMIPGPALTNWVPAAANPITESRHAVRSSHAGSCRTPERVAPPCRGAALAQA